MLLVSMLHNRHITIIVPALNEEPSIARVLNGLFNLSVCSECSHFISDQSGSVAEHSDAEHCYDEGNLNVSRTDSTHTDFAQEGRCSNNCGRETIRLVDQIIVCDNGSSDRTAAIALACGAKVVEESERGYGAACLAALASPHVKDIIVFVDADHSVVEQELPALINPIFAGADLVIGSRTLGRCERGALSLPQALGNQLASALMRLLWRGSVTDLGPFRAVTNDALTQMRMSDRQFGWTVEMQIRAIQLSFKTVEVPVSTRRRIGKSKISGTVRGVIGAAHGILGTIGKLYWRQISGAQKRAEQSVLVPLNKNAPINDNTRK